MKTNKIVARVRVERKLRYSKEEKRLIKSLLIEQITKVFSGIIEENEDLYLTSVNPIYGGKETEFCMFITIQTEEDREKVRFADVVLEFSRKIEEIAYEEKQK